MADKTQNLSVRLLRDGLIPEDAVREDVVLNDWPQFNDAKIVTGPMGGGPPDWTKFLNLPEAVRNGLYQRFAFGLVFLLVEQRWFAIAFGLGHSKLNPASVEQDFGLRVVLNAVDHKKLRSADLRTPDSNTLSRRSQTSRGSERSAFEIDPERDIVRGLLGEPKDKTFATRISGGDALTLKRKASVNDLPEICARALEISKLDDYKAEFGWIDQISHVRDPATLATLRTKLVEALTAALALNPAEVDDLSLAYPAIYDPEKAARVRFRGYSSNQHYADLEIAHYLAELKTKEIANYELRYLTDHSVQECDDDGKPVGPSWHIEECLVFETGIDDACYTLSGGRWYRIDTDLAKEVSDYFSGVDMAELPAAEAGDNEKTYNARLAAADNDLLSMDVKLVKPSDASSAIEVCDFLGKNGRLVHIKDKSESSRLSHLFNQGVVSAVILKRDADFRDRVNLRIAEQPGGADYAAVIPGSKDKFDPTSHTVIFGVLVNDAGKEPKLPFFSLITFRHAARRITDELGYPVAFAWIKKPGVSAGVKATRRKKGAKAAAA